MTTERGKPVDELEEVDLRIELDNTDGVKTIEVPGVGEEATEQEAAGTEASTDGGSEEIRLNREQTLQDLRELQELTVERASGRTSDSEG